MQYVHHITEGVVISTHYIIIKHLIEHSGLLDFAVFKLALKCYCVNYVFVSNLKPVEKELQVFC